MSKKQFAETILVPETMKNDPVNQTNFTKGLLTAIDKFDLSMYDLLSIKEGNFTKNELLLLISF